MPGANCSIPSCGSCRNDKTKENIVGEKFGIFKVPSATEHPKWHAEFLKAINKDRVVTPKFKEKLAKKTVWVCERHFKEEQIYRCEYFFHIYVHYFF